jgi:RNA-dependent RNA polymerase
MLEEEDFNREITGDEKRDSSKFRRRVGSLHPGHERVAPYCHHLRIVLYKEEDLDNFENLCKFAGLQRPIRVPIDAYKHGFCSPKRLHNVHVWLRALEWRVAFQLETILHNALLNTEDLLTHLYGPINKLWQDHPDVASVVLRYFTEALQSRPTRESPLECFERVRAKKLTVTQPPLPPGTFQCHHVCFAPTRMILEGPYVIQSNRVIREWAAYHDKFIRVDFRDEDRLQYRWDREVDGRSFLEQRVGGILKNGFELAGRRFEFLAYSSSALR